MQQIINMVFRMFLRKLMNAGIEKGVEAATKSRSRNDQEKMNSQDQNSKKRIHQAARMGRRFGRFMRF